MLVTTACSGATGVATTSTPSSIPEEPGTEPTLVSTTTTTTEPLPRIDVVSYSPNDSSPVADLVVLRGDEYLFDPAAEVLGGSGALTFAWDFDGEPATVESDQMDPDPVTLVPGEYFPILTVTDEAGQLLVIELPRIVKIGDTPRPDWEFGVVAHLEEGHAEQGIVLYPSDAAVDQAFDLIVAAGIEGFRVDFGWPAIEWSKDTYNWGIVDGMVDRAEELGLEVIAVAGYSPQWVSSCPQAEGFRWAFCPPTSAAEYGEFIGDLAERYSGRLAAIQLWNEPNLSIFFETYDPADYFPLLRIGYLSAKYADPSVTVLMGPLANGPEVTGLPGAEPQEFITDLYERGAALFSDAASLHPYTDPYHGVSTLIKRVTDVRKAMDAGGAADQLLWITEYGYPTGYSFWSEQLMADWLKTSFDTMRSIDGIGPLVWYNLRDKGEEPSNETSLGLVNRDFTPKLTYHAYQDYIATAADE